MERAPIKLRTHTVLAETQSAVLGAYTRCLTSAIMGSAFVFLGGRECSGGTGTEDRPTGFTPASLANALPMSDLPDLSEGVLSTLALFL